MTEENRRGWIISLLGLTVQTALAGLLLTVWLWSDSPAAIMVFMLSLTGVPVWLVSAIIFYCRALRDREAAELELLAQQAGRDSIFGEDIAEMRLAERRLRSMERYLAPATTILLTLYSMALAYLLLTRAAGLPADVIGVRGSVLRWAFFSMGGAFAMFLFSRYAIGMSKEPAWRLLRAGGSYMTLAAFASALLTGAFLLIHFGLPWGQRALCYIVPITLGLLGAELLLSFMMDFYRPRVAGAEQRPSFDSRLANLLSQPGSIAHSIAEALNYQFGFEVSGTWFYQLLRKTFVPLLVFGALSVVAISSIVVVGPGQQAVVLTWGSKPADNATLGPGIHLKYPWPIQSADVGDVERVRMFRIGVGAAREDTANVVNGVRLYLWTVEHGEWAEQDFLVPRQPLGASRGSAALQNQTPPAPGEDGSPELEYNARGLLRVVADIQYQVKDFYQYKYGSANADGLLQAAASEALTQYTATHDLDSLMTVSRGAVASDLRDLIQARADELELGVDLAVVSIQGIHPPPDAATAFEEIIMARREAEGAVLAAETKRAAILSQAAGSPDLATRLVAAIEQFRRLQQQQEVSAQTREAKEKAEQLLRQTSGEARVVLNEQEAYRWERINEERMKLEAYRAQTPAYEAAPRLYVVNKRLQALADALTDVRKIVLAADKSEGQIWLNLFEQQSVTAGLPSGEGQ